MRLTCPACGAEMTLDAAIGHEGARDAVKIALSLPAPLGKRLIQYLALFRPAQRQLSLERVASLLGELQPQIEAAQIERHGRVWAVPQTAWAAALDEMIMQRDAGKLRLPLKTHGYLYEILTGHADKAEGKAEQQQETTLQNPYHRPHRAEFIPTKTLGSAAMANIKDKMKGAT